MADKKDDLKIILNAPNIQVEDLDALKEYILSTPEYKKLFRCTQMRDEVLRNDDDNSENRGTHTIQVAKNAAKLCEEFFKVQNEGKELTDEQKKQILIAEIVGLSHDLGHTPMGHASEDVFSKKVGQHFGHDQYSGVVFSQIFERFCKGYYATEAVESMKAANLEEYIIEGIQNHGKYFSHLAEGHQAYEMSSKQAGLDIPLICGRLADTLSFMPADLQDLSQVDRADGISGKILSKEIMMKLVEKGETTTIGVDNDKEQLDNVAQLPTEKIYDVNQTLGAYFSSDEFQEEHPDFDYEKIIDDLVSGDKHKLTDIQAKILQEVAEANYERDENGRVIGIKEPVVSISDKLKDLRYQRSKGIIDENNEELIKETNALRKSCPTLALIYEMQDELIYNQILAKSTKVLGNAEQENAEVLNETFDIFEKEYSSLDKGAKDEFDEIFKVFEKYMPLDKEYSEKGKNGNEVKSTVPDETRKQRAYAIYKMQKLSNDDIDQIRETRDFIKALEAREETKEFIEAIKNMTIEQQEMVKEMLIKQQSQEKKIETRTVTPNVPNYGDETMKQEDKGKRVAIFGEDCWKNIVGDRKVEDLNQIAIEITKVKDKSKEPSVIENYNVERD